VATKIWWAFANLDLNSSGSMTATGLRKNPKKRKQADGEAPEPGPFTEEVHLEMLSDEEDEDGGSGSSDGEVDEFPEIDTRTDSEDEEYEGSQDGSDEEDDEESSEASSDADSGLHIFPESKTILSNITGQPKQIYPEIEPDYDSDSSTEDVRCFHLLWGFIMNSELLLTGSQSRRQCTYALVR